MVQLSSSRVAAAAQPVTFSESDYDSLLKWIGDARFVLIGEASHGTHDFYRERALITKRLIEEMEFTAVAVEADWPDAFRVNRFVRGRSDENALHSLDGFKRFPAWMWRNMDVLDFIDWLRRRNDVMPENRRAGFYGLDLYSLHASAGAVLRFLDKVDPAAAERARQRYACFEQFGEDTQAYGYATSFGMSESCEKQVVSQLVEMQRRAAELARHDGNIDPEELFSAEQNARLVKDAETYYRTMFRGHVESWNVRDQHMADTLSALADHAGPQSKFVIWAHNSHVGDARATRMGRAGEFNIGQLARERYGDDAYLIGFTTHNGEVTAASDWGGMAERKRVRAALPGSIESEFHEIGIDNFLLSLRSTAVRDALSEPRLERAIGVIYLPETERASHYFDARVAEQFDAVIHIDHTLALIPLERTSEWEAGEPPETYPFAV
ncbi:MAG: hypothetical protein JWO20_2319 [Candidatus Angelobacter sp.]|jgi:erythromycin esterase-like protein|nr:hypothetical protein [Candidatus Angelobacter sp.]